jgi:YceI-like domain
MKLFTLSIFLLMVITGSTAQEKLITRNASISFYSKAPLENIEAHTQTAASVLDKKTGQMEFSVLIKSFEFQKALMHEHFNENYLESDMFPKSVFVGHINDPSKVDFSQDGKYTETVTGQLTIHGQTKMITAPVAFTVQKSVVSAVAEFSIDLADYRISIPGIVKDKISKTVRIAVKLKYESIQ